MACFSSIFANKYTLSICACILLHYWSAHLYVYFCAPVGLIGFLKSPFMTLTPQCQFLRWSVFHSGALINVVWTIVGLYLFAKAREISGMFLGSGTDKKYRKDNGVYKNK